MEFDKVMLFVVALALTPVIGSLTRRIALPRANRWMLAAYLCTLLAYGLSAFAKGIELLKLVKHASYGAAGVCFAVAAWFMIKDVMAWRENRP